MCSLIRLLIPITLLLMTHTSPAQAAPHALVLDIQGAIGPAVAEDVHHTLARAGDAGLVILRMDTPGGLDQSMRKIIQDILASPVPVATFVAPQGARAASAGTYILYASHIAAMSPATNLGAATPVQIGALSKPEPPRSPTVKDSSPDAPAESGNPMQHKMVNDATAYIRSLAQLRQRNVEWAEMAVREAASLSAEQALKMGVIDLIAQDIPQLLEKVDGRTLSTGNTNVTLHTRRMRIETVERNWRSRLLAVISDPNVAYVLMLLGIYGLFFELANPGTILPGVIGGISLLLALFAFQVLPVNYAGLALIFLGIAFMIGEAFAPSFGALGLGGVIAFVAGSVMLMDTGAPGFALSMSLIFAVALCSAAFFILIIGMAIRARLRPVVTGAEEMIGLLGTASEEFDGTGHVLVHGETWQAMSTVALSRGQTIRVSNRNGLILQVDPAEHNNPEVVP
ncbi:MAG: serine protease [Zetaproteobacteria bacterium CG12_big_fil_rev_8_21_14_0_65_54_13]|nr:MAG: serine protease [Zetaproteobacteria bacterium CG12_big_fil_rev_8_21_14_0_65_54_13]PIX54451.1 MAG: serine protease [Zetaproteobacteria bacterium CG_4_10_14_3_um_filter_54_28]PJA28853.1 MAG: serine protease [Zetaproteobacteria bacterium CG_4_9_14_3_um_filter_54_145]